MTGVRRPFGEALASIGVEARFVGEDPHRPTHVRLSVDDRAILWPMDSDHIDVPFNLDIEAETGRAVANMVANASLLARSGHDVATWAALIGLEAGPVRTAIAFQKALIFDSLAQRLLSRSVLEDLLLTTMWRAYLYGARTHDSGRREARHSG